MRALISKVLTGSMIAGAALAVSASQKKDIPSEQCPVCDPPGCGEASRGGKCQTCNGSGLLTKKQLDECFKRMEAMFEKDSEGFVA